MFHLKAISAVTLTAALAAPAFATDVALPSATGESGYGAWTQFSVDEFSAQTFGVEWIDNANSLSPDFGSPLTFTFTIAPGSTASLTVVDGGFAGDTFRVTNLGSLLGSTSSVAQTRYDTAPDIGLDFEAALANSAFSRATFALDAGNYRISGALDQSVLLDSTPLNATVGAVRLTVSAVPEPSTVAMMLAGLGMVASLVRRRRS